jgi:hypothetical protein
MELVGDRRRRLVGLHDRMGLVLVVIGYQISLERRNDLVSERPFVYADGWHIAIGRENAAGNLMLIINYRLVNSGNTPTRRLALFEGCGTSPTKLTEPFISLLKQPPSKRVSQIIGPRSSVPVVCTFSDDDAKQMSDGKLFGYILGEITYSDELDPSKRHKTEYAVTIEYPVYALTDTEGNFSFSGAFQPVGQHNCADEDCPPDPTE